MRRVLRTAIVLAGVGGLAGTARAHQVGGTRFDSPIPLGLLFLGAAATVAATAVWFGVSSSGVAEARSRHVGTVPPTVAVALSRVARLGFALAFVATLYAGLFGPQVRAENFATVFVWPVWIRGLALAAVVVGSPWRVLSPWLATYDLFAWLEGDDVAALGAYPAWLGEWPAVCLFVAGIGVVENLTVVPQSPQFTATLVAAYAVAMLAGGVAFGREWFRRADALAVFYRLLARVAPIDATRQRDGSLRIALRTPWRGAGRPVSTTAAAAFVVATVYTLSFDGFTSTPEYQTLLFDVRSALGLGPVVSLLLYAAGFVAFLAAFGLVVAAIRSVVEEPAPSWRTTATAFAPTVLPISAAYEVAHNYPYVLRNAGQLATVPSRRALSTSQAVDPLWWLTLPAFWWSQVLLVVAGHVVAVVAAHDAATRLYDDRSDVRRAHVPTTALMIGYTVLSLWIVSRPVVA